MSNTDSVKWNITTPGGQVKVEAEGATVDTHSGELHVLTPRTGGGRDIIAAFAPGQWEAVERDTSADAALAVDVPRLGG